MNPIALSADPAATSRLKSPVGAPTDAAGDGTFGELIARFGADGQDPPDQAAAGGGAFKPVTLKYPILQVRPAQAAAGDPAATDVASATSPSSLDLAPLLAKVVAAGGASQPVRGGGKDGGAVSDASDPSGGAIAGVMVSPPLPGVPPTPLAVAIVSATAPSSTTPTPSLPPAVGTGQGTAVPAAPAVDTPAETAPTRVSAVTVANHLAPAVPSPTFSALAVATPAAANAAPAPAAIVANDPVQTVPSPAPPTTVVAAPAAADATPPLASAVAGDPIAAAPSPVPSTPEVAASADTDVSPVPASTLADAPAVPSPVLPAQVPAASAATDATPPSAPAVVNDIAPAVPLPIPPTPTLAVAATTDVAPSPVADDPALSVSPQAFAAPAVTAPTDDLAPAVPSPALPVLPIASTPIAPPVAAPFHATASTDSRSEDVPALPTTSPSDGVTLDPGARATQATAPQATVPQVTVPQVTVPHARATRAPVDAETSPNVPATLPVAAGPVKAAPASLDPMPHVVAPASEPLVATAPVGAVIAKEPSHAVPGTSDGANATDAKAASDATVAASADPSRIVGTLPGAAAVPGPVSLDAGAGSAPLIRGIADTIAKLASSSPSSVPTATDDPNAPTLAITPARTLTLQLNPGSLGTVSVRLHLTGGALDVQLGVSDPQTLGLIARERDTLVAALRDQSTPIHSLTIGGGDVPPPGGNDAPSQRPAGDQAGNRPSGGGPGAGPSGGQGDRAAPDRRSAEPSGPLAPAAPEPGGALFV